MSRTFDSLSQLLTLIAEELDISDAHYELAVQRYKAIGTWLERKASRVAAYRPEIHAQGSLQLGTATKPISEAEEYDLDIVCELLLQKGDISQKALKELIGGEIKAYARQNTMHSPVEEGRRCWTLQYVDGAQFHMDILPAIPDAMSFKHLLESQGHRPSPLSEFAIAITDKKHPNYCRIHPDWACSNPKGYAAWFRSRMKVQFNAQRNSLAASRQQQLAAIPVYQVKTTLQRAIQLLKRHRDIMFAVCNTDDKPISIIITTLAAHAYRNEPDVLETLQHLVADMPNYIQKDPQGVVWIPNPVNPLENFADKWQEHPERETHFHRWLLQVQQDLGRARELGNLRAISESLKPCLGERALNEAMRKVPGASSRSAPLLGAVGVRKPKGDTGKDGDVVRVTPRKPYAR